MAHGYRNRPVEQAEHFVDGWYRTGDLGRLGDDGHLHVLGRAADCTVVDGRLVTPTGIEDTLMRRPDVRYAVVVADPERGRRIAAVLPWGCGRSTSRQAGTPWPPSTAGRSPTRWSSSSRTTSRSPSRANPTGPRSWPSPRRDGSLPPVSGDTVADHLVDRLAELVAALTRVLGNRPAPAH